MYKPSEPTDELLTGSVTGVLTAVEGDGEVVFALEPVVGPSRVVCHVPPESRSTALAMLGRYVLASGTLRYKSATPYPYAIDLAALEMMPDASDLPSLSDLRGVAPDATGGTPPAEYVRRGRAAGWT